MHKRGVTLIEILIVLAILGILASIVLVSTTLTRQMGNDSATRQNIVNMSTQATLYYNANGSSYEGLCDDTPPVNGARTLYSMLLKTQQSSKATYLVTSLSTQGATNRVTCHAKVGGWAVEAPLTSMAPVHMYCIDSRGIAVVTQEPLQGLTDDVECGAPAPL